MVTLADAAAAIELARGLLQRAVELQTSAERRQQAELDRMIQHVEDKATLVEMTDQAFRTHNSCRVADQLTHLLDVQGVPRFFSPIEQAMLRGFQSFGEYLPGVAVPLVKEKMRRETANVILPAEPDLLSTYLRKRQSAGVGMNVNLLGEAVLGEKECQRRIEGYIEALNLPDVRCVSVKISTVFSQVSPLAREHTIAVVADRLEKIYRFAASVADDSTGNDTRGEGKFVYLDMEEYRDLHLTAESLRRTLDRDGLGEVRAGIALQAYVPDSHRVLLELIDWSRDRVAAGGTPLTVRLVKGANMEMERVEASVGGFEPAPYQDKIDTDANFKRMLRASLRATATGDLRVGLASHNLFDVALGLVWAGQLGITHGLQIEMLEGMANHQRRAITERVDRMLLYAPACTREGFINAIGYLIRRLDENTGPQNFLRHAFNLQPDGEAFDRLANDFRRSLDRIDDVADAPRRNVDRHDAPVQPPAAGSWSNFVNEPDTDWAVPANSAWIADYLERLGESIDRQPADVPLLVGDTEVTDVDRHDSFDPSVPGRVVARFAEASLEQTHRAVEIADAAVGSWSARPLVNRHGLLREVAQLLRVRRGELIATMVAEGGKTVMEADPEVSEAIDFCEFYPLSAADWLNRKSVRCRPRGVVAVITPWNFPLAIPCGGIASALAVGNTVILKPAAETVWIAAELCRAFWDAGVPHDVLQMIPCDDQVAESGLVANATVAAVVLTGGTATAKRMLAVRPNLHLLAETGGKNATIVTSMADRDLAIKHVTQSAFGHAGQKCSATSLLLLEDELFNDKAFRSTLADAVESLPVGSAWDLSSKMGPLIAPPSGPLAQAIGSLEDDESWLVEPAIDPDNPNLVRPGVKWDVREGGFSHVTELFGPVLSVMRFSKLERAIEIVRSTGYGLTSGIESLDDREIELWKSTIHAGNLYINRPTTGAIVLRQPFGGIGLSSYGPGVKAGGPHYVLPLMHLTDGDEALQDDWRAEFDATHDHFHLVGQDNQRRYDRVRSIAARIDLADDVAAVARSIRIGIELGTPVTLSIPPGVDPESRRVFERLADQHPALLNPVIESDGELTARLRRGEFDRLRYFSKSEVQVGGRQVGQPKVGESQTGDREPVLAAAAEAFVTVISEPPLSDSRIEGLRYLNEQSISHDYHRYGNLGRRAVVE